VRGHNYCEVGGAELGYDFQLYYVDGGGKFCTAATYAGVEDIAIVVFDEEYLDALGDGGELRIIVVGG
jgi:hypothetical protein